MVIALALCTAFANAVASICERLGVEDAPGANGPSVGLVRHMVKRPVWVLGFVIMAAGYGCQAVALHLGSLNVVQPILVSELVMLVVVLWFWYRTPLRARDFLSALATATGLGLFLAVASPSVGTRTPSNSLWLEVGLATVAAVLVIVVLGSRGSPARRALLLGAGASAGFALTAALTKAATDALVVGAGAFFASWQLYAVAVVGLGSFIIMQSAFQVGPFAASQSTLILVNPLVAIVIGHVLYGETLRGRPFYVGFEVLALATMVAGALGLSSSALVSNVHGQSGDHLLAGRGRYAQWRRQRVNLE